MSTRSTRASSNKTAAVTARSLSMQKPEPVSGNAWCVPPAVLHARPWRSASRAVSSVPEQVREIRFQTCNWRRCLQNPAHPMRLPDVTSKMPRLSNATVRLGSWVTINSWHIVVYQEKWSRFRQGDAQQKQVGWTAVASMPLIPA